MKEFVALKAKTYEKILQTANCMINYHLEFLISILKEAGLSKERMPSKLSSLLQRFLRG